MLRTARQAAQLHRKTVIDLSGGSTCCAPLKTVGHTCPVAATIGMENY
jgi:hypothetical protein